MTTQIQKQKPSDELRKAISSLGREAAGYFKKLGDRVNEVLEMGRKEGFTDLEIGDWIREETKENYSKMTISRILPPSAKHMEKSRSGNKMLPKLTEKTVEGIENNESPSIGDENHPQISEDQPSQQQESIATANLSKKLKVPSDELSQSQAKHQISESKLEQPGRKEVRGIHNITPDEYEIECVEEYDRDLLIKIVKWQHENIMGSIADYQKYDKRIHEQALEIESLKKELTGLRK